MCKKQIHKNRQVKKYDSNNKKSSRVEICGYKLDCLQSDDR